MSYTFGRRPGGLATIGAGTALTPTATALPVPSHAAPSMIVHITASPFASAAFKRPEEEEDVADQARLERVVDVARCATLEAVIVLADWPPIHERRRVTGSPFSKDGRVAVDVYTSKVWHRTSAT